MLSSAFNFRSAFVGSSGGILLTISRGIAMGVFTNEAGLGTSGIAISQGVSKDPYKGGLIAMFGIFVDTVLMCNITAITFLSSVSISEVNSGWDMASEVFKKGFYFAPYLGSFILMICICFFAFASIIGWSYYGEVFFLHTFKKLSPKIYKYLFSAAVFLGSFLSRGSLFYFSDIFNALMAYPNVITLALKSREIRKELIKRES
jgi:AGCS family alanine or glycine:cation symporter